MLPATGVRTLMKTLEHCLARQELDASCGILRRLLSETQPDVGDIRGGVNSDGSSGNALLCEAASPVIDATATILRRSHNQRVNGASLSCLDSQTVLASSLSIKPASVQVLATVSQRTGRWSEALLFAAHMDRPPSAAFVSTLVRPGNWKHVDSFRQAHRWSWNVPMAMERLFLRFGAWDEALDLAIAAEHSLCVPVERHSLAVLVPMVARHHRGWAKALGLFHGAIRGGFLHDEGVCASLFSGCVAGGHWQLGLNIFKTLAQMHALEGVVRWEQKHAGRDLVDDLVRVSPGWLTALRVLENVRKLPLLLPSRTLMQRVILRCDVAGQWEAATSVYDAAVQDGIVERLITPSAASVETGSIDDVHPARSAYQRVVQSFIRTSQWQKAVEAVSWMSHAGEASANTGMTDLLELCETAGQWSVSLQLGSRLLSSPSGSQHGMMDGKTYLSLLFACATGRQWMNAMKLYDRMIADPTCDPHPVAACAVLQACVVEHAWVAGLTFFERRIRAEAPRIVIPPLAVTLATHLCVKQRRWAEALLLLDIMVQEGLPMDNHGQKLGMWAAALSGSWERSLHHFSKLARHQRTLSDSVVVRSGTRFAGPLAAALVMKHLQASTRRPLG